MANCNSIDDSKWLIIDINNIIFIHIPLKHSDIKTYTEGQQNQRSASTDSPITSSQWTCEHCTFTNVNNRGVNCEMCNLPKA